MKHGPRIWEKKLGRSPTHRTSLLTNLLTELVKHEQIETTVAKAQFLKHEMEKVIVSYDSLSTLQREEPKMIGNGSRTI
jgi:ribosomal protein L17